MISLKNINKSLFLIFFFCFSIIAKTSFSMTAETISSSPLIEKKDFPFSISLSSGFINGDIEELIYQDNKMVSKLKWELKNVMFTGGSASFFLPYKIVLNIGARIKISEADTYMEDFDWLKTGRDEWADYSKSNSELESGEMFDTNLVIPFFRQKKFSLSLIAGFKHDHWSWSDRGGYFIYSSENGFRDHIGEFENKKGISYEQWLYVPYLGIKSDFKLGKFLFNIDFLHSNYASGKSKDNHLLRNIRFEDTFNNMNFFYFSGKALWLINKNISAFIQYENQEYKRAKGDMRVIDQDNSSFFYKNGAGLSNKLWSISLGINLTLLI